MKRLLPFVLFLAAIAAYAADPQPVHVFVLGTTDLHGSYDNHHESKTAPAYGGLPLIAGYLNVLRANHGRVIVVDSVTDAERQPDCRTRPHDCDCSLWRAQR